jgi:hypothetical protein
MIMFDLENTLIDSWNSKIPLLNKWEIIKNHINEHLLVYLYGSEFIDFGVFSFAVDLPHEKPKALAMASSVTQHTMNPDFCPCWQDLEKLIDIRADLQKWEVVNLYQKAGMFDIYTREYPELDFLLFDDYLPDAFNHMVRRTKDNVQSITKVRV